MLLTLVEVPSRALTSILVSPQRQVTLASEDLTPSSGLQDTSTQVYIPPHKTPTPTYNLKIRLILKKSKANTPPPDAGSLPLFLSSLTFNYFKHFASVGPACVLEPLAHFT